MRMRAVFLALVISVAFAQLPGAVLAQQPASSTTLDYEFFRTRVQPIFVARRDGHARCITCHREVATFLLQPPAAGTNWTEEQSRANFQAARRLVVPGSTSRSKLLVHPLRFEAGGTAMPYHTGGKHWDSVNDPEWQTLAAWVRGETAN